MYDGGVGDLHLQDLLLRGVVIYARDGGNEVLLVGGGGVGGQGEFLCIVEAAMLGVIDKGRVQRVAQIVYVALRLAV